jgi:hypothetical protein
MKKYGTGKSVAIKGAFIHSAGVAKFTENMSTINMDLSLLFAVDGKTVIQADLIGASIASLLKSKDGSIFGSVSKHTIGIV